jgi:hypothetical protein
MASAVTSCQFRDAAAGGATSVKPIWFTACPQPRAMGSTRAFVKVKYLTWTDENLLRQVVYEGLREDKAAADVLSRPPFSSHLQARAGHYPSCTASV